MKLRRAININKFGPLNIQVTVTIATMDVEILSVNSTSF